MTFTRREGGEEGRGRGGKEEGGERERGEEEGEGGVNDIANMLRRQPHLFDFLYLLVQPPDHVVRGVWHLLHHHQAYKRVNLQVVRWGWSHDRHGYMNPVPW